MTNSTMAKAVKYTLKQWDNLKNFILDGKAEISNNLVEQRMKPIKLDLKNSQNIGREEPPSGMPSCTQLSRVVP